MEAIVSNKELGTIYYKESAWTGKKEIWINQTKLVKIHKNEYEYDLGDKKVVVEVKGSFLTGVFLYINNDKVTIVEAPKWYEIVLCVLIFSLTLTWGNSVTLCSIIPIAGGAIGGLISGACQVGTMVLMRKTKKVAVKLLIALGMLLLTFLLCFLAALLLISILL